MSSEKNSAICTVVLYTFREIICVNQEKEWTQYWTLGTLVVFHYISYQLTSCSTFNSYRPLLFKSKAIVIPPISFYGKELQWSHNKLWTSYNDQTWNIISGASPDVFCMRYKCSGLLLPQNNSKTIFGLWFCIILICRSSLAFRFFYCNAVFSQLLH